MGIETAAFIMAGIAGAAKIGQAGMQYAAANQQEQSLALEGKELQLKTQQDTLANYDVMEKTIDAQIAKNTVSGTAANSPSFNAIQRNTLNIGAKANANTAIEGGIEQANIEAEKKNVKSQLYSQLFGDASDFAFSAASVATKLPTKA